MKIVLFLIVIGLTIAGVIYFREPITYIKMGIGYKIGIIKCPKYVTGALPSDDLILSKALHFFYLAESERCNK